MPALESGGTALRTDLSVLVQEFRDGDAMQAFIGSRVAPVTPVGEAEGRYPVWNRENYQKLNTTRRAENGAYNRIESRFGTRPFECEENGLEERMDDRRVKRYASFFDAEAAAARTLYYQIMLAHEKRVADLLLDASTFTATNVSTSWETTGSSDPLADLDTFATTLQQRCGAPRSQMSLILPLAGWQELRNSDAVWSDLKYIDGRITRAGQVKAAAVAEYLEIKEVVVGAASYDSAEEGASASMSALWGSQYGMLAVLGEGGDMEASPGVARTLLWTDDSPELPVVESYRDESVRSDIVRVRYDTDEVLTAEADVFGILIDWTAAS